MKTIDKHSVFGAWAPVNSRWSPWVKPVLFAHMELPPTEPFIPLASLPFAMPVDAGLTAIVVDLPGAEGVKVGLALARLGWRPVPLYNSIPAPSDTLISPANAVMVDAKTVMTALWRGAEILETIPLPDDAPPVFLLDSLRRGSRVPWEGDFDNRSVSFPTDFPSANLLLHHGIKQALLVQESDSQPQPDVAHTLRRWQEAGLRLEVIAHLSGASSAPLVVDRPHRFKSIIYRMLEMAGLKPTALGGFGGFLPESQSGG